MKSVIAAVLILIIVIGCAMCITFHFQSFAENMLTSLEALPNDLEDLNEEEQTRLRKEVKEITSTWDEEFQRLAYIVSYTHINRADTAINTMYTAVCTQNSDDYAINRREAMDALHRLQELQGMHLSAIL